MGINQQLKDMAAELKKFTAAKIYFHKSPDGDAIGSAYALAFALHSLGIKCEPVCEDSVPGRYGFLTDGFCQEASEDAALIAVDSASPSRLGNVTISKFDFCIDHHEDNSIKAVYKYVDKNSSSCCEIIYQLILGMGVPVTKQIADLLYAGIVTDTSCFRGERTTPASLRAAAELAGYGADIVEIGRRFCLLKDRARMGIENALRQNLQYSDEDNRILGTFYRYEDLQKNGIKDSDLEGLNAFIDQVEGISIGIVVREISPGYCRISVRTYGPYNAGEICAAFGGGGHADCSGANMKGMPEAVLKQVEKECLAAMRKKTE